MVEVGGSFRSTGDSCRDNVQSQIYALYAKYGNKFSLDHLHEYSKPDSIWKLTQNCYNSYGLVAYGTGFGTWMLPPIFGAAAGGTNRMALGIRTNGMMNARGTNGMPWVEGNGMQLGSTPNYYPVYH
jgi:hypothetical protein